MQNQIPSRTYRALTGLKAEIRSDLHEGAVDERAANARWNLKVTRPGKSCAHAGRNERSGQCRAHAKAFLLAIGPDGPKKLNRQRMSVFDKSQSGGRGFRQHADCTRG